ncbi:heavy metal-binding domain-containing protein [Candidatus Kaiserbacteria bacterium]|nr:heavy metal-binding domain-containing protein [Candidatus Kaiserbacteria bacterium]MCB9812459.1 heavy metal-binding domain-containing protein [Candidatus Nomurabacteria bacterium]
MINSTVDEYLRLIDAGKREQIPLAAQQKLSQTVQLTSEAGPFHDLVIKKRFEPVHAIAVYGTFIVRDWFAAIRDVLGGRSRSSQNVIVDAIEQVQNEVRLRAWQQGANYVVGFHLSVSEVSGKGKAMHTAFAYGTPLVVEQLPLAEQRHMIAQQHLPRGEAQEP